MKGSKRWMLLTAVAATGVLMSLAVACSDDSDNGGNATATESLAGTPTEMAGETPGETMTEGAIHISEAEYSITGLDGAAIESPAAGHVTFEVHNDGEVEHSFYVFKTDTDEGSLPLSGTKVDEAQAGDKLGEIETIASGSIETLSVDLTAGKYVLICNVAGHYTEGMHAAFDVM